MRSANCIAGICLLMCLVAALLFLEFRHSVIDYRSAREVRIAALARAIHGYAARHGGHLPPSGQDPLTGRPLWAVKLAKWLKDSGQYRLLADIEMGKGIWWRVYTFNNAVGGRLADKLPKHTAVVRERSGMSGIVFAVFAGSYYGGELADSDDAGEEKNTK